VTNVSILQTIVTPEQKWSFVQMQISDSPLLAEDAAIRIALSVRGPEFELALLAHYQRIALERCRDAISGLLQSIGKEITENNYQLNPTIKRTV
jgi:hypothetical protein